MSDRSVTHATFVVQRSYPASPARAFKAWADPTHKARWFMGGGEMTASGYQLDFRDGGAETNVVTIPDGTVITYSAVYEDIVPDSRIVYRYTMQEGARRSSVSLSTVEFRPEGSGTRLVYTEQGVFLDGMDTPAQREEGTEVLLDFLKAELERG